MKTTMMSTNWLKCLSLILLFGLVLNFNADAKKKVISKSNQNIELAKDQSEANVEELYVIDNSPSVDLIPGWLFVIKENNKLLLPVDIRMRPCEDDSDEDL